MGPELEARARLSTTPPTTLRHYPDEAGPAVAGVSPFGDRLAITETDRFVVDLESALLKGGRAAEGAAAFLKLVADRAMLVSTNSRDTGLSLATKLRRVGLDVSGERLVLAGEETVEFVARRFPRARCLFAVSPVLRHCARRHGLMLVADNPDVVILGRDTAWTYEKLAAMMRAVDRGAMLVATNADATQPGAAGLAVPGTGALLAAIETATGKRADHVVGGRSALLGTAIARLGADAQDVVVIGDEALTDETALLPTAARTITIYKEGQPGLVALCSRLALPEGA